MIIKLVRHGESQANIGKQQPYLDGDWRIGLTPLGKQQAHQTGAAIGKTFLDQALIYHSPYQRTCETTVGILAGAEIPTSQVKIYEDPRLREVEVGYKERNGQHHLRQKHGWFYYRFENGESPADCYDRMCTFLESLTRQVKRSSAERMLIVSHGFTIRCFVMRFLHVTVRQYEMIKNPENCDIITLEPRQPDVEYPLASKNWGARGLRLYS